MSSGCTIGYNDSNPTVVFFPVYYKTFIIKLTEYGVLMKI